jgi:predicted component of type VI protein secretion system
LGRSQVSTIDDLDRLIAIAQDTHDALQQAGAYTYDYQPSRSNVTTSANSAQTQRATTSRSSTPAANTTPQRKRITPEERVYLSANNGCFWCRKINAGHMLNECPEFLVWKVAKDKAAAASAKLKASVSEVQVVQVDESSSDSEYPVSSKPNFKTQLPKTP